jgi:hypothetical protein
MNNDAVYEMGLRLWIDWTVMWNGKPELARSLVADTFALHLPTPGALDQETIGTPEAVERWVTSHRASFVRLSFETHCGPFVDTKRQVVAGPWVAHASMDGSPRVVCGMDTLAFRDGKIIEYWTLSKEADVFGRWPTGILVRP